MAKLNNGVADDGLGLPGKVLQPNSDSNQLFDSSNDIGQFGDELQRPDAAPAIPFSTPTPKPVQQPVDDESKRFAYWQSEAQKAQDKAKALEAQLSEKAKYDPLVAMIQKDEVSYQFLQNRLNGNRTPDKPLEPPQRPANYSRVEADSNPESLSAKYEIEQQKYLDQRLQRMEQQNSMLLQEREQERVRYQQQQQERENLLKFKTEVVSKGIPEERFGEFLQLTQGAGVEDMVDYFKWKNLQTPDEIGKPRFDAPLNRTASFGGPQSKKNDPMDIGNAFLEASRRM